MTTADEWMLDEETVYRVDERDVLVYVNDEWDRFALDNGGRTATADHVLYRPLWDFINGAPMRHLYRTLLEHARAGDTAQFGFRCDSPDCERLLRMHVEAGVDGTVEFRTRTLSVRRRPVPAPTGPAPADELLLMCAWCRKISVDSLWRGIAFALERKRLLERDRVPDITHGICADCARQLLQRRIGTEAVKPMRGG